MNDNITITEEHKFLLQYVHHLIFIAITAVLKLFFTFISQSIFSW